MVCGVLGRVPGRCAVVWHSVSCCCFCWSIHLKGVAAAKPFMCLFAFISATAMHGIICNMEGLSPYFTDELRFSEVIKLF